jgi:predicted amidohydrolase YtcJ
MSRVFGLLFCLLSVPALAGNTLLFNATIHTVDPKNPEASALVFSDEGVIVAVGDQKELSEEYADATRHDAEGHTVVPGLIDAHGHLMNVDPGEFGLGQLLVQTSLIGTPSIGRIIEQLKQDASDLPPDAWLVGRGWDQNDWPEQAFPTRSDLDEAFPDRPVWLIRVDGHAGWANTAAMERAGLLDEDVSAPEGGKIVRDEQGAPTGVLVDAAMELMESHVTSLPVEVQARALREALERTASLGLTGVHEAGTSLAAFHLYQTAIDLDSFPIRLYAMADGEGPMLDTLCERGPVIEYGDRLVARSVKFYMDGALGSRGAALLEPYSDDPDNRGLLQMSPDRLRQAATEAMECGLQVNTHAIGDRGNREVLDAYAEAMDATGGGPGRHRVEHAQVVALEDIPRFADLGLIAAMQPTHATSDMPWAEERLGPERIKGAYAWQRFLEAGVPLALGSDFPVEQVDPLLGFHAAVTRQDPEGRPEGGWYPDQRLSREEALRGFTLDAARAAFMEDKVGSLEPGKRADFVILSDDIMSIPAPEILETRVLATYLDGRPVYRAP